MTIAPFFNSAPRASFICQKSCRASTTFTVEIRIGTNVSNYRSLNGAGIGLSAHSPLDSPLPYSPGIADIFQNRSSGYNIITGFSTSTPSAITGRMKSARKRDIALVWRVAQQRFISNEMQSRGFSAIETQTRLLSGLRQSFEAVSHWIHPHNHLRQMEWSQSDRWFKYRNHEIISLSNPIDLWISIRNSMRFVTRSPRSCRFSHLLKHRNECACFAASIFAMGSGRSRCESQSMCAIWFCSRKHNNDEDDDYDDERQNEEWKKERKNKK